MIPFTESLRYEINGLTPESVVLDVGAYEGNWGRLIAEKYGCRVHMFEPVRKFYQDIMGRLAGHPNRDRITVHNFGIGDTTRDETFRVHGDQSGVAADGPEETVQLIGISDLLNNSLFNLPTIGCLKLNCEAGEYEILEALLEDGMMARIGTVHVQFHNVIPNATQRMANIKNRLLITHRPIWDEEWVWSGWEPR